MNNNVTSKLSKNHLGTGDIRLRIETTKTNQSFRLFYRIKTEEGGYISVDWGDGNTETFTGKTIYEPEHTYATAGEYIVKLTGSKFTEIGGATTLMAFRKTVREILSLKMPTDSVGVSLSYAFFGCTHLTGNIPKWDNRITHANATYYRCANLTGNVPEWGVNITDAGYTYYGCKGLTGNIPAWGASITSAGYTYNDCTGLTGSIPEWGASITNAYGTYNGCTGLTGEIPAWGVNITDASGTYNGCIGLTGCSEELLQDPMPSRIRSHIGCVFGCAAVIRQHFTENCGGTKAS